MPKKHVNPHACMAKLNEHCQKNNLKLEYKDINTTGPPHDPIFTVAVVIDKKQYSQDTGKSKKEAKAHAAVLAWDIIEKEMKEELDLRQQHQEPLPEPLPASPPPQSLMSAANSPESSNSVNYVSKLNEYALKNKVDVQYIWKPKSGLEHKPIFSCACRIGDKIFDERKGGKAQTAKREAARLAYERLFGSPATSGEDSAISTSNSLDMSFSDSQEVSSGTSVDSAKKSMDIDTSESDSVSLEHSGEDSKKTYVNSEMKEIPACAANNIDSIELYRSSSSQVSLHDRAVKPKRKEAVLAAKFPGLGRYNKYTKNERFLEEFEDIEKIGSGAFGNVFKARHKIDNRICAVKRIRFLGKEEKKKKEVQVLAKLNNQYIVRYFNCWIGKDIVKLDDSSESEELCCLFIDMEYCDKGTLAKWIRQKPKTTSCKDDSVIIFKQIVEGVRYIHFENFIHRDLKPTNIFLYCGNKVKIGDFGLVTSGVYDLAVQRTMDTGTPGYMAPEQEMKNYDMKVDIFPLGLILFELLFSFATDHEKIKEWPNIRGGKLPKMFVKEFSSEASLIKKMLSKEPSQRPSAADLLNQLQSPPAADLLNQLQSPHTC